MRKCMCILQLSIHTCICRFTCI